MNTIPEATRRGRVIAALVAVLSVVGPLACQPSPTTGPSESVSPSPAPPTASPAVSESPSPSVGRTQPDVCELLPTTELSNVLAGEIAFPTNVSGGGWAAGQCAWSNSASSFLVRVGTPASISAFGDAAAPDARSMLAAYSKRQGASAESVAGIGDGAVLGVGGLAAYVGETYVEVTRLRLSDDQLVGIMRLAIANL